MKKAFTIIELIFFIVIIGLLTSQIPIMLQIINKKNAFSKTEDGIYNTFSLMNTIKSLPWDIQNIQYKDIIQIDSNPSLLCDFVRPNGFQNRTCSNNLLPQPSISQETIDGWNNIETNTTHNGVNVYRIVSKVSYINDNIFINQPGVTLIDLSDTNSSIQSNIKKIQVYSIGKKLDDTEFLIENLNYYSTNIGHILIEKRDW